MNAQVHVFALPDSATTVAIEDEGMTWAICTDIEIVRDCAIVLFHAQAIPLDPEWNAGKCMSCGERTGEEMPS